MNDLAKKLLTLGACYLVVASALVIYLNVPVRAVAGGGILVLIFALVQYFTARRR